MTEECRNDCLDRLLFPKQLDVNLNRPGLSRIDYRIGTYADIREALLRHLNLDPVLTAWTHREADDPGIALLEGAAILGDILTFYQDLYANEAYLRTAQWRESVADLVRLLGYRLSPGVGGRATFAVEVTGEKPVVIPMGFPIKAQLEGLEKQAEFETQQETVAYPALSKFHLYRNLDRAFIDATTKEFYIASPNQYLTPTFLEKGDRILIGDTLSENGMIQLRNSEILLIDDIYNQHGRTYFKIKGSLNKRTEETDTVTAYKLGRSFRHFGHNAPRTTITLTNDGSAREYEIAYTRATNIRTSSVNGTEEKRIVEPSLEALDFPLENEVNGLALGCQIVVNGVLSGWERNSGLETNPKEFTFIRTIKAIQSRSMTWGSISGATTLISLDYSLTYAENSSIYYGVDIRQISFHEVISSPMVLRARPIETAQRRGYVLNFYGTYDEARSLEGRKLFFQKSNLDSFAANVTLVQKTERELPPELLRCRFLLKVALDEIVNYTDFPNQNPTVNVYGNLVPATQGKTEREAALGNGDSRESFQTFKLPKAPLTYFIAAEETPPEVPELEIFVSDRRWQRVPSFFGHGPKEEIYIVREDDNGDSWVQFGDGKTGARLPSGIKNVVAKYRTGIGAQGPLKAGATPQTGGRLDRLKKVYLPGAATGGDQPETGENAKAAAPGKVQSLGRLVSLQDFETEALGIAGITKVSARWALVHNVPMIVLTVLMAGGGPAEETALRDLLSDYNRERGPNRFPIQVCLGQRHYVYLTVSVGRDPTYREDRLRKAILEALGVTGEEGNGIDGSQGLFSLGRRQFVQPEYATRIEATLQNLEGVVWASVAAFGSLDVAEDPLTLTLPDILADDATVPCASDQVLSLHTAHFQPTLSVVAATEVPGHG